MLVIQLLTTAATLPLLHGVETGSAALAAYASAPPPPSSVLDRGLIAGIWRLTASVERPSFASDAARKEGAPRERSLFPLKEFTVRPISKAERAARRLRRRPTPQDAMSAALLILRDDGTFTRCGHENGFGRDGNDLNRDYKDKDEAEAPGNTATSDRPTGTDDEEDRLRMTLGLAINLTNGTWDLREGDLVLAADRSPTSTYPADLYGDGRHCERDTVFVGRVLVQTSDEKNRRDELSAPGPAAKNHSSSSVAPSLAGESRAVDQSEVSDCLGGVEERDREPMQIDNRVLSVPEGRVEVGRFVYPRRHRSFFDRPMMFEPATVGSFRLRQVLASSIPDSRRRMKHVEKFRKEDISGKRFLLTSQPMRFRPKKGKMRWSKLEGHYVEDRPPVDTNEVIDIRVMKIELFPNNTFSTVGVTTSQKMLRGKWTITGEDRDQLWLQVCRFGFLGRSTPGSVFSEGKGLTHDDERIYWGTIRVGGRVSSDGSNGDDARVSIGTKLEVNGNVLCGKVPQPISGSLHAGISFVGTFTMMETSEDDEYCDQFDCDSDDDYHGDTDNGDTAEA